MRGHGSVDTAFGGVERASGSGGTPCPGIPMGPIAPLTEVAVGLVVGVAVGVAEGEREGLRGGVGDVEGMRVGVGDAVGVLDEVLVGDAVAVAVCEGSRSGTDGFETDAGNGPAGRVSRTK